MNRKKQYVESCKSILTEKRQQLNDELDKLKTSLESETKSSAGDKYETSREMINQEKNKLLAQFAEIEKQENTLSLIKEERQDSKIQLGSIVSISDATYFISVSMGKVKHDSGDFMAISPASPIGQLLLNKEAGDQIAWQGKTQLIISVE